MGTLRDCRVKLVPGRKERMPDFGHWNARGSYLETQGPAITRFGRDVVFGVAERVFRSVVTGDGFAFYGVVFAWLSVIFRWVRNEVCALRVPSFAFLLWSCSFDRGFPFWDFASEDRFKIPHCGILRLCSLLWHPPSAVHPILVFLRAMSDIIEES
jgi:hypothetical protein